MVIKHIHFRNFRCFEEFNIDFGKRATVIFGKNGSGKTSLLIALRKALSFILASERVFEKYKTTGKRKLIDSRTITNGNPYLSVEGFGSKGDCNNPDTQNIDIKAVATLDNGEELKWSMSASTENGKLRSSRYLQAFRQLYQWYKETDRLPVLAYYSDSYPNVSKSQNNNRLYSHISDLRNFGYIGWNTEEGVIQIWKAKLERDLTNLRQAKDKLKRLYARDEDLVKETLNSNIEKWQHEIDSIERCVVDFSKSLSGSDKDGISIAGLDLYPDYLDLRVNTIDGCQIRFTHLPSAYKRLYGIVLDLAFRSYLLSGNKTTDYQGIAIIDEIDLHLSPHLERVILPTLLKVFPQVQFIVSTNSANVLTSINTTDGKVKLFKMVKGLDKLVEYKDLFGLDTSSTQQEIMGVRPNGEELERLLYQCVYQ